MKRNLDYSKENPSSIQTMFGNIANQYDRTNAILSFNLHKYWNSELICLLCNKPSANILLDLCSGTGEIALGWLRKNSLSQTAYLLDFCEEMLQCAKQKCNNLQDVHSIHFLLADAEKIPLPDNSVDFVTVAYGIRNIRAPDNCFKEVLRVLKPGGKFGILELTEPENFVLKKFHAFYLRIVLPIIGGAVTRNKEAYEYLCQSIKNFTKPKEIKELLQRKGYQKIVINPLSGGIATIITAEK